jgi:formamidopyrimidine-DNA glycosylase
VPELPDIVTYLRALEPRIVGQPLEALRLASPFVLRSVDPPVREVAGKRVLGLSRIGKRIGMELDDELFVVVHLMVSGRFQWKKRGDKVPGKVGLGAFDFPTGSLVFTEASTKKRASIHLVRGRAALAAFSRGGVELLEVDLPTFTEALQRERHTLTRALTDPRLFSGIGNAYSDEILHAAQLSPVMRTDRLDAAQIARLYETTRRVLMEWTDRLSKEAEHEFPTKVTAFRPEMAVHGKFDQPCPVCSTKVQRIVYAENESNYCPRCQTGGKLLADRSLSRVGAIEGTEHAGKVPLPPSRSEGSVAHAAVGAQRSPWQGDASRPVVVSIQGSPAGTKASSTVAPTPPSWWTPTCRHVPSSIRRNVGPPESPGRLPTTSLGSSKSMSGHE